ncbi:MAG: polysaccharide deacetylase family protein, partial [Bdellovibrionales bacterium]|nr:polysaccharide deacetylase family protein [Oligoflexia bacterium]
MFHSKAYRGLRHLEPRSLVIFNYHRIRSGSIEGHPFDEGVFGPTQETLWEHMNWLKRNTNLISEQDLIDHVRNQRKLPKASVMVTFDDGYSDNAELALPVLKEHKIPAIFFISTHSIENRELGWWDTIAYMIKKTKYRQLILRGRTFDLNPPRRAVIHELQEWMRTLRADNTASLIQEISAACEVPLPGQEMCSGELMTWEQIAQAASAGITIGSHTHSHRVLSTLNLSEQFEEFRLSKQILEKKLGRPILSVAYPVGGHEDCHLETGGLAEKCGYQLGFSFQTGANHLNNLSPFGIRRVSAEDTLPLTCAAVSLPTVFARSRSGDSPKRSLLSPFCADLVEP